jgi:hypothetical protein
MQRFKCNVDWNKLITAGTPKTIITGKQTYINDYDAKQQ